VGYFARCLFKEAKAGGIDAVGDSAIFVNNCDFIGCNIDVSNSSENVIGGVKIKKEGGTGIVCSKGTRVALRHNWLSGSCVDVREGSRAELMGNQFENASLNVWGGSNVNSEGEFFKGTINASISLAKSSTLSLRNLTIEEVEGSGLVVYDNSSIEIETGRIAHCSGHGVVVHSGSTVVATDLKVVECADIGVIIQGAAEATFTRVKLRKQTKSGAEIGRTENCTFSECVVSKNGACGLVFAGSKAVVHGCNLSENKFASLHLAGHAEVQVSGGQIKKNLRGGILVVDGSSIVLTGVPFAGNAWSGIVLDRSASGAVRDCQFEDNDIGIVSAGSAVLQNATFKKHRTAAIRAAGVFEARGVTFSEEQIGLTTSVAVDFRGVLLTFEDNQSHIQTDGGKVVVHQSVFRSSKGSEGVHARAGSLTFSKCDFFDDNQVAIFSEAETNVDGSKIKNAGKVGVVCGEGSSGTIQDTDFETNGECALQCVAGRPTIKGNRITDHTRFGVFIQKSAAPILEDNIFGHNGMANVWRDLRSE
jgi:parallel beta-helix repeat protein